MNGPQGFTYKESWQNENAMQDAFEKWSEDNFAPNCATQNRHCLIRECQIGNGFADFVLYENNEIIIYELKITATVASVIQLKKYEIDLKNSFARLGLWKQMPNIRSVLVARYFEAQALNLLSVMDVEMMKIILEESGDIEFEQHLDPCLEHYHSLNFEKTDKRLFERLKMKGHT